MPAGAVSRAVIEFLVGSVSVDAQRDARRERIVPMTL